MDASGWQEELDTASRELSVPGATLGILRVARDGREERAELATGVLHLGTGVAATPDSLFQIGSITKVWTTTLVMQLVDEGRVALDAPVGTVLPELRFGDDRSTSEITLRHLLSHSSGFDGDVFTDTGRGDDCLERFVASLAAARRLFAPGSSWSYNNAGFASPAGSWRSSRAGRGTKRSGSG